MDDTYASDEPLFKSMDIIEYRQILKQHQLIVVVFVKRQNKALRNVIEYLRADDSIVCPAGKEHFLILDPIEHFDLFSNQLHLTAEPVFLFYRRGILKDQYQGGSEEKVKNFFKNFLWV